MRTVPGAPTFFMVTDFALSAATKSDVTVPSMWMVWTALHVVEMDIMFRRCSNPDSYPRRART